MNNYILLVYDIINKAICCRLLEGFAMNVISSTAFGVDISNKETNDTFVYYGKKAAVGNIPYKAALFISESYF